VIFFPIVVFDSMTGNLRNMSNKVALLFARDRIPSMSAMGEKLRGYDLALAVFDASLGPGRQEAHLRKQYAELQDRLQRIKRKRCPRQ
jgi:hypothetical protein